jgi:hypothetical protein
MTGLKIDDLLTQLTFGFGSGVARDSHHAPSRSNTKT